MSRVLIKLLDEEMVIVTINIFKICMQIEEYDRPHRQPAGPQKVVWTKFWFFVSFLNNLLLFLTIPQKVHVIVGCY